MRTVPLARGTITYPGRPVGQVLRPAGGSRKRAISELYMGLARERYAHEWQARLDGLARAEAQLATAPDGELRFHSGPIVC